MRTLATLTQYCTTFECVSESFQKTDNEAIRCAGSLKTEHVTPQESHS